MVTRWVLIALLWVWSGLAMATITVQADRNPVAADESFSLTFGADGGVDDDPDFSPLEALFTILSQSQNSSIQIINGQVRSEKQWVVQLMARQVGRVLIPAIAFGKDRSPTLELEVVKGQPQAVKGDGELFLEVTVDREQSYPQAQLIYTVKLFRAVNISNASLSEPEISGIRAVVRKLGSDSEYETQRGRQRYLVIERRYAIYPEGEGELTINPLQFEAQIASSTKQRFGLSLFNTTPQQLKRVSSKALHINVLPIPPDYRGQFWIPATDLLLEEQWPDGVEQLTVGEPVTRTLILKAEGLMPSQLPELPLKLPDQGGKYYPDQPTLDEQQGGRGITGQRTERVAIIPTQAGRLTLPAIELQWWDTRQQLQRQVSLPARTFVVVAAASEPPTVATARVEPAPLPQSLPTTAPVPDAGDPRWFQLSIGLGAVWLLTLLLWALQVRRLRAGMRKGSRSPDSVSPTVVISLKAARDGLKRACKGGDARLLERALLEWASAIWPDDAPLNLTLLAQRLPSLAAEQLSLLIHHRYGGGGMLWDGKVIWNQLSSMQPNSRSVAGDLPIAPLYPH